MSESAEIRRAWLYAALLHTMACTGGQGATSQLTSERLAGQFVNRLEREFPPHEARDDYAESRFHRNLINLELFSGVDAELDLDPGIRDALEALWRPGPMRYRAYANSPDRDRLWEKDSAEYYPTVRKRFHRYYRRLQRRASERPDDQVSRGLLGIGTLTLLSASINYDKKCALNAILGETVLQRATETMNVQTAVDARAQALDCQDLELWSATKDAADRWLNELHRLNPESQWLKAARYYYHPPGKSQILGPRSCMAPTCRAAAADDPVFIRPAATFNACRPLECDGELVVLTAQGVSRSPRPGGSQKECASLLIAADALPTKNKASKDLQKAVSELRKTVRTLYLVGLSARPPASRPWAYPEPCAVTGSACEDPSAPECESLRALDAHLGLELFRP